MKKELKDYLNLYLPFDFNYFGFTYKVIAFRDAGKFYTIWHEHGFFDVLKEDFRLPLRPLTNAAFLKHGFAFFNESTKIEEIKAWATCINKMRKDGFDCDDLIPSGLAIDAETITTK